jgi:DNA-directed RNA polymerase subunit beta'
MPMTLGQHLLNDLLPDGHKVDVALDKSSLTKRLTALARQDRGMYVETVSKLKRLGDHISTTEGVSLGLDDLTPEYATRDKIMSDAQAEFNKAKTREERDAAVFKAQDAIVSHTKTHGGSMTEMALTGARGNIPQLMKIVSTPVAAADAKGNITPYLINRAYSEGLTPGQYWTTVNEARINTIKSTTSVSEPGDVSKIFVNTMYPHIITEEDCGTKNGIHVTTADNTSLSRHLAKDIDSYRRNDTIDTRVLADLKKRHPTVFVRSPMTCEADVGVCKMCQGLDENLQSHVIGANVGVRAAQALSEPLTQMTLNSKHGVRTLKGNSKRTEGLQGVRQLLEIPASFNHKAALASEHGTVTKVQAAPHGGHYITVNTKIHYAGPGLDPKVTVGQKVEAGDMLTDGIMKPDEVVKYKGLGVGRQYLAQSLQETYGASGVTLDRRHLELLVRANVGHVKITEGSSMFPHLLKGETYPYNQFKKEVVQHVQTMPLRMAAGHILGEEHSEFSVGTELTPSVVQALATRNVSDVKVVQNPPHFEFITRPVTRTPLLDPDWMARLSHRYLKENLLKGAHTGATSDLHSTHPVSAYAHGAEFGEGHQGRY